VTVFLDVLTTGRGMEEARATLGWPNVRYPVVGVVVYARGPCPDWVKPLFPLWQP
jgi:hypothetical protein